MSNERLAQMRIIPIDFPKQVQLEFVLVDADKKPLPPGLPATDPPETWSALKRRLVGMTEADFAGMEPLLKRGEPHLVGVGRVLRP
jgi:hypothetical protein